jgi:hypothetical protein
MSLGAPLSGGAGSLHFLRFRVASLIHGHLQLGSYHSPSLLPAGFAAYISDGPVNCLNKCPEAPHRDRLTAILGSSPDLGFI